MSNVNGGVVQNRPIIDDDDYFMETMHNPSVNEKKYEDVGNMETIDTKANKNNTKIIDDGYVYTFNDNVYISDSLKTLDDPNIDPLYRIEVKRMLIDYFMLVKPNDTNLLKELINKINNTDLMKNIGSYIYYNS